MAANILFDQLGRQRHDRVYRERVDQLDQMRDEEVRRRYRFNKENTRFICNLLRGKLQQATKRSQALSVELQVLIALRFCATGSFLQVFGDTVGVDKATASRVVRKVSFALAELLPVYVKWPSDDEKREMRNEFYRMAGFPGVIGCIDGTHVRIQRPSKNEPVFINRKGYPSINVQAVCDSKGACAVLHNLAILLREPQLDQNQDVDIGEIKGQYNGQEDGNGVRNYITRTFFRQ